MIKNEISGSVSSVVIPCSEKMNGNGTNGNGMGHFDRIGEFDSTL